MHGSAYEGETDKISLLNWGREEKKRGWGAYHNRMGWLNLRRDRIGEQSKRYLDRGILYRVGEKPGAREFPSNPQG